MRAFVFSPFFLLSACAVVAGYRLKLFFFTQDLPTDVVKT